MKFQPQRQKSQENLIIFTTRSFHSNCNNCYSGILMRDCQVGRKINIIDCRLYYVRNNENVSDSNIDFQTKVVT